MKEYLSQSLDALRETGPYKEGKIIESPQDVTIMVEGKEVLNFCTNNYLGLSNHPRLIEASKKIMDHRGFGMSSVRFIYGTQDIHKELEAATSEYFRAENIVLYATYFDANSGLFGALLTDEDAIVSGTLNHASVINDVRLCKAKHYRCTNGGMTELEKCLKEVQARCSRIICTDGVFSMDGNVAPMNEICDPAGRYDALVVVDESHSAGVVGATGHGVSETRDTYGRVGIYTRALGKAFSGALERFTTGRKEIIDMLRQNDRPYLFFNSSAPSIIGANLGVFKILKESSDLHDKLMENVTYFRDKMPAAGFDIRPTQSVICAVMFYDASLSQKYAAKSLDEGIYVTGFYYPAVPKGEARIRVQLSTAHTREQLDKCINAFIEIGEELGVLK